MFNCLSGEEPLPHLSLRPFLQAAVRSAHTRPCAAFPGSPAQAGKSHASSGVRADLHAEHDDL